VERARITFEIASDAIGGDVAELTWMQAMHNAQ
jgi:hypothetical protein